MVLRLGNGPSLGEGIVVTVLAASAGGDAVIVRAQPTVVAGQNLADVGIAILPRVVAEDDIPGQGHEVATCAISCRRIGIIPTVATAQLLVGEVAGTAHAIEDGPGDCRLLGHARFRTNGAAEHACQQGGLTIVNVASVGDETSIQLLAGITVVRSGEVAAGGATTSGAVAASAGTPDEVAVLVIPGIVSGTSVPEPQVGSIPVVGIVVTSTTTGTVVTVSVGFAVDDPTTEVVGFVLTGAIVIAPGAVGAVFGVIAVADSCGDGIVGAATKNGLDIIPDVIHLLNPPVPGGGAGRDGQNANDQDDCENDRDKLELLHFRKTSLVFHIQNCLLTTLTYTKPKPKQNGNVLCPPFLGDYFYYSTHKHFCQDRNAFCGFRG